MSSTTEEVQTLRAIAHQAMLERHLQPEFPPAALRELQSLVRSAVNPVAELRDLRQLPWISIDNDDSRDLDQLSVAEPLASDTARVRVAVADVDALVTKGGPIDGHAAVNTTSVYTISETFPMLPLPLSADLTPLGEGQERAALIVEMSVDAVGAVVASDIYRAVVVNRAKLAYPSVAAWLSGASPPPRGVAEKPKIEQQLRLQQQVAERLRRVRHDHGALSLASTEPRAVFEGQRLRDLVPDPQDAAQALIEHLRSRPTR